MKKENKLVKFTVFVLLITIVALVLVAGTYAKYTSEVSGASTATVAKWQIKANGHDITVESPTVTFDLFETVNDTGNTAIENDVVNDKIAPGTAGKFDIKIDNLSEVTAEYEIKFVLDNPSNIPVEFSTDGTTWKTSIDTIESTDNLAAETGTDTVTIQWRWAFEGANSTNFTATQTDVTDTTLGTAETLATIKVTTTLTATQVD